MYAALHSTCTDKFPCSFLKQFGANNDAFACLMLGFVCFPCSVSVAGHISFSIDCSLCMPVQDHVYEYLTVALNLLGCTEMREQYKSAVTLMNMLKLGDDHQIFIKHCIIKCTLHAAITALGYGLWS